MKKLDNNQIEKIIGGQDGWPISPTMMCWIATVLIFEGTTTQEIEAGITIAGMFGCAN
jgi:hypothetical protein